MDHLTLQTDELRPHLVRLGRRLRLRDGWLSAQRSLWIPCLAAAAIQLAGRVWPIASLRAWTLVPLALWLLAVIGVALFRPLPLMRVARRVDSQLGLKERLATAMALEGKDVVKNVGHACSVTSTAFPPALVALQRQDALSVAQRIDPRRAFPLLWLQRSLLIAALLIAAAVTLVLLPNRMDALLEERAQIAQAAEEQARRIEELQEEIEGAQELTPQEREELLRRLAELARQLRDNPGDREEALADLSRVQGTLQQKLDPNASARQATLEGLAAQLQALAAKKSGNGADPAEMDDTLQELAAKLAEMSEAERQASAQSLAQMAARAAQAGESGLAQALAALAQAAQSGDPQAASEAAQSVANAMEQAQVEMASQAALQRVLAQLEQSRHAMTQAGQGQSEKAAAQVPGSGQGGSQGQGQPNSKLETLNSKLGGQGQGGSQGGGQGGQGTKADSLPPGTGTGSAGRPQGEGPSSEVGRLDQQIYVPWERLQGSGEEFFIPGQDTGQGETQVRERKDPLPGAPGQALVPYHEVYYHYLDTANQAMEQNYIPSGLKEYVREYFSRLEP